MTVLNIHMSFQTWFQMDIEPNSNQDSNTEFVIDRKFSCCDMGNLDLCWTLRSIYCYSSVLSNYAAMATGLRLLIVLSIASLVCPQSVRLTVCPRFVRCSVCPCPIVAWSILVWTCLIFGLTFGLTHGSGVAFWYPSGSVPTHPLRVLGVMALGSNVGELFWWRYQGRTQRWCLPSKCLVK